MPCHHRMARPQVEGAEEGLDLWSAAGKILDKQSRRSQPTSGDTAVRYEVLRRDSGLTDSVGRLKQRNVDMRFSTGNVISLHRAGSLITVAGEVAMYTYKLH
jgi:hypothetical protein